MPFVVEKLRESKNAFAVIWSQANREDIFAERFRIQAIPKYSIPEFRSRSHFGPIVRGQHKPTNFGSKDGAPAMKSSEKFRPRFHQMHKKQPCQIPCSANVGIERQKI
jgi:hypothetical protein